MRYNSIALLPNKGRRKPHGYGYPQIFDYETSCTGNTSVRATVRARKGRKAVSGTYFSLIMLAISDRHDGFVQFLRRPFFI
jgi:hypothetical protein